jgi:hypothetical protein
VKGKVVNLISLDGIGKYFPLQLNTCKEHKLLPWYSITKCNFYAFLVSLQDILVCKCNVNWFIEA